MPAFLITPDKSFHLIAGVGHLLVWLMVMPFLAAAMIRFVGGMNEASAGQPAFLAFGRVFFASISFVGALFGAALLSVYFLAQSGLIKSPWE